MSELPDLRPWHGGSGAPSDHRRPSRRRRPGAGHSGYLLSERRASRRLGRPLNGRKMRDIRPRDPERAIFGGRKVMSEFASGDEAGQVEQRRPRPKTSKGCAPWSHSPVEPSQIAPAGGPMHSNFADYKRLPRWDQAIFGPREDPAGSAAPGERSPARPDLASRAPGGSTSSSAGSRTGAGSPRLPVWRRSTVGGRGSRTGAGPPRLPARASSLWPAIGRLSKRQLADGAPGPSTRTADRSHSHPRRRGGPPTYSALRK